MEISDLVGTHMISGFDRYAHYREGENCEVCRVVLDGQVYEFRENPDDGYRSYHEGPDLIEADVKNRFPEIEVEGVHKIKGEYGEEDDILVLKIKATGADVLEIGTSAVDDYYPCWICNFSAEALGER